MAHDGGVVANLSAEEPPEAASWPALNADHPLSKLSLSLSGIVKEAGYDEIYGINLENAGPFRQKLILQKFLRANTNDVEKAKQQLLNTLKWRKAFQPLKAKDEVFSRARFRGLGFVQKISGVPGSENKWDVVTFNIYGAVKDNKLTFEDLDGFLRWRVALMEKSIELLPLHHGQKPIPDLGDGPDPYQGFQVHDYLDVSFLSQDKYAKAAAKRAIDTFAQFYPELLNRKFFVNVPIIMGWMFSAMKLLLSKETVRKFTVLTYGNDLASELGRDLPRMYGGEGRDLDAIGGALKLEVLEM